MSQEESKKLENFLSTIIEESNEDIGSIKRELSQKYEAALAQAEASLRSEAQRQKEARFSEIRSREGRRVNSRMTANKQTLLQYREDCANEVFAEVKERVQKFTETPEYLDYLTKSVPLAIEKLKHGYSARVYLRADDMKYAQDILNLNRGVTLTVEKGYFRIGGFHLVCPSRGMRIDMCFDTALKGLVGHFAEQSGMQVE